MWAECGTFQRYLRLEVHEPKALLYFPGTLRVTVISLLTRNYMTHINPPVLGELEHFLPSYAAVSFLYYNSASPHISQTLVQAAGYVFVKGINCNSHDSVGKGSTATTLPTLY